VCVVNAWGCERLDVCILLGVLCITPSYIQWVCLLRECACVFARLLAGCVLAGVVRLVVIVVMRFWPMYFETFVWIRFVGALHW
jgi:hypothetical protein